jgi:hypothetical protein
MASPSASRQLVEVADPPVPSRTTPIQERSAGEKTKNFVLMLAVGGVACTASWWLLHHGFIFYGISSGAIGLFCVIGAFFGSGKKAACPYCSASVDVLDLTEGRRIRCERCNEYSSVNTGLLRPLDPATTSEAPEFESPVYRDAVWPNGCVACGAPPVRFDNLSQTSLGGGAALLGAVQLLRGSVKGIPYCDKHREKLGMKVTGEKKMYFRWSSLRMMRRYVAANRNRATY